MQIPIYSIDAFYHSKGDATGINRANPDGTTTKTVGYTNGTNNPGKPLNIGMEALKIWGKSGVPEFD